LEAKSSKDVPSLPQLDFAGLKSHYEAEGAAGCLLVAPSYPGPAAKNKPSEVALRSGQQKVSCWTVEQLARVVELAEARRINARDVERIVLTAFTPDDVTEAVRMLLEEPTWHDSELYGEIVSAIISLEPLLKDSPRTVDMIATKVATVQKFSAVELKDVRIAIERLSAASQGMLHFVDENQVYVMGDVEELRRRVASLTGDGDLEPRRRGSLRRSADADAAPGDQS
jgi:hypothetical protein